MAGCCLAGCGPVGAAFAEVTFVWVTFAWITSGRISCDLITSDLISLVGRSCPSRCDRWPDPHAVTTSGWGTGGCQWSGAPTS